MQPARIALAILNNGDSEVTADEARTELTRDVVKAMVREAKDNKNVDAARWLEKYSKDALPLQDVLTNMIVAARDGNVDAVRWLEEHDYLKQRE